MKPCVAVEGSIGAGKTTFLKCLNASDLHVIREPVDRWTNVKGFDLLSLLYEDPAKWSTTFQSYVLLSMLDSHTKSIEEPIRVMERSVFSGRNVFLEQAKKQNNINPVDFEVLQEWYGDIISRFELKLDLIVYLKTTPSIAWERMKKRGRVAESNISLSYMHDLHERYEKWLATESCEVITINADDGTNEMKNQATTCQEYVVEYFK